jgi:hypothetical protein
MNYDNRDLILNGPLTENDEIWMSWKGNPGADWNPINFLGDSYIYQQGHLPFIWYGKDSGMHGMNISSDELHVCWKSKARGAPDNWIRLKSAIDSSFVMRIYGFDNTTLQELPELVDFDPPYGSTIATENTTEIKFNFHEEEIYPAKSASGPGILRIHRGAVKPDGTIGIAKTAPVLWEDTNLDDTTATDKFKQGDIEWSLAGHCLIQLTGDSKLKPGEIYYLSFYGHTFKNENGYYLFGPDVPVGVAQYQHMFQCRSFDILSSDQIINGNYVEAQGTGLLYNEAYAKMNGNDILTAKFQTRAIKLALRVANSTSCSSTLVPSASIHIEDITDTSFVIRNLDLKDCYQGDLVADATLIRGIKESSGIWSHLRKEYLKDLRLGSIGCDSSCRHWSGPDPDQCILCSNTAQYLYDGTCVDAWPTYKPYSSSSTIVYNKSVVSYNYCTNEWDLSEFANDESICTSCNSDCLTCTSASANSWTSCRDFRFLLNQIWVSDCPSPFYTENYNTYVWDSTGVTSPISVQIQNLGYETRVKKDRQIYLKAEIYNSNPADPISLIQWTQLDPAPASDSVIIFTKDSFGVQVDFGDVVQIKMSAFNYMGSSQSIKVLWEVTSTGGNKAIDIIEFYLNDSPFAIDTGFTSIGGTDNKESMKTNFTFDVSEWYNSVDDKVQKLTFRTYFTSDSMNFMITDFGSTNNIDLKLPYLSRVANTLKDIELWVQAKDDYGAATSYCESLTNVTSNYAGNFGELVSPFVSVDMTDHNSMLQFTNMVNFLIKTYELNEVVGDYSCPGAAQYIWKMDFHCNQLGNGKCDKHISMGKCICNYGYLGTYCQHEINDYYIVRDTSTAIVDTLYNEYLARLSELSEFDAVFLANIFNGLLVDYDAIPTEKTEKVIKIFEAIGNLKIYNVPKSIEDRKLIYSAISRLGAYLLLQFKHLNSNSNFEHSKTLYGIKRQEKVEQDLNVLKGFYKRYKDLANKFIEISSIILNPTEEMITFISFMFEISLQVGYPFEFVNQELDIRSNDVFWTIPSTLFDNYQDHASNSQEIKLKLAKWTGSPIMFDTYDSNYLETNMTEVTVLNTAGVKINITNLADPIRTRAPWTKKNVYQYSLLKCKMWDSTTSGFSSSEWNSFSNTVTQLSCSSCNVGSLTTTTVSVCNCTSFGLQGAHYDDTESDVDENDLTIVYPNYSALEYWQESFGFYLTFVTLILYLISLIITVFLDQFARRKVLIKIYEKIRKREVDEEYSDEDGKCMNNLFL